MRTLSRAQLLFPLFALLACASGESDRPADQFVGAQGGMVTVGVGGALAPDAGGATAVAQGGSTSAEGLGGAATGQGGRTVAGVGGSIAGSPAVPLSDWKSFSAQGADPVRIEAAYTEWKTAYYRECGSEAYVFKTDTNNVVSEGIAYGMLITANADKPDEFGKLWTYYKNRRNGNGVMNWSYASGCSGGKTGDNGASDAELDAAMALLIAASKGWGGSYSSDATALISAIRTHETTNCNGRTVLKPGDAWGGCDDTNPSYFAPGYYRVFGQVTGDTSFWNQFASDSYWLLSQYQSRMNGKVPDWGRADGTVGGVTKNSAENREYGYDACRIPWRIALDYGWFLNADAKTFLTTMDTQVIKAAFGSTPYNAAAGKNNSAFIGAFATVGTSIDQTTVDAYFTNWYDAAYLDDDPYFQGTLKVIYLITMGGRFSSSL